MAGIVPLKRFNNYLNSQGYALAGENYLSSRVINRALYENSEVIIKRDRGWGESQNPVENEILNKFNGLERIPKKIAFEEGIFNKIIAISPEQLPFFKKLSLTFKNKVEDNFLVEKFIPGKSYNYEQLSPSEEQKLIDLVNLFHKEGYARLDIGRANNFILNPQGELYYIDLGKLIKKGHPQFDFEKGYDLFYLDETLTKSREGKTAL
jgi:hypothetical protein